jgi:hypothetical protein
MGGGFAFTATTWEYKFVDVKNDRKEFEKTITQHGKDGWEFCSSERFGQNELVLVFKKRKGGGAAVGAAGSIDPFRGAGQEMRLPGPGMPGMGGPGGSGVGDIEVRTFNLTAAKMDEVIKSITTMWPQAKAKVVGGPRADQVIVVADPVTMKEIATRIGPLDGKFGPPVGPGPSGPPMGMGVGPASGGLRPGPATGGSTSGGSAGTGKELQVVVLKHAAADEMVPLLKKVFATAEITADTRTNQLIIRADAKSLEELKALLAQLDVEVPKKR